MPIDGKDQKSTAKPMCLYNGYILVLYCFDFLLQLWNKIFQIWILSKLSLAKKEIAKKFSKS